MAGALDQSHVLLCLPVASDRRESITYGSIPTVPASSGQCSLVFWGWQLFFFRSMKFLSHHSYSTQVGQMCPVQIKLNKFEYPFFRC